MATRINDPAYRILDEYFEEAQVFFNARDFQHAFYKCDQIKHYVERLQFTASHGLRIGGTAIGAVAGIIVPGVGNLIGGIVGGTLGNLLGKYVSFVSFSMNDTIEDIKELAGQGKRISKSFLIKEELRKRNRLPVDDADNIDTFNIYALWLELAKNTLDIKIT